MTEKEDARLKALIANNLWTYGLLRAKIDRLDVILGTDPALIDQDGCGIYQYWPVTVFDGTKHRFVKNVYADKENERLVLELDTEVQI